MSETAQDQDFHVINTPGGHRVRVRNYTTGADEEELLGVLMAGADVTLTSDGQKDDKGEEKQRRITKIDSKSQLAFNRLALERFIVAVDDTTDDMVNKVIAFRRPDYRAVVDYITDLTKEIVDDIQKDAVKIEEKKD